MAQTWSLSPSDELLGEPVLSCVWRPVPATSQLLSQSEKELLAALDAADAPVLTGQSEAWPMVEATDAEKVLDTPNAAFPRPVPSVAAPVIHLPQLCETALLISNQESLWDRKGGRLGQRFCR